MSSFNTDLTKGKTEFFDQLKQFLIDNGIVGTAAGVSIALVTKDLIASLVGDIIIPAIILLCLRLNIKSLTAILPGKSNFDITNFFKQLISWVLGVIITFLFVKTAFEGILGVSAKPVEEKEEKNGDKKKESFFSY
jgi:large-conductance mechanosensitive channel